MARQVDLDARRSAGHALPLLDLADHCGVARLIVLVCLPLRCRFGIEHASEPPSIRGDAGLAGDVFRRVASCGKQHDRRRSPRASSPGLGAPPLTPPPPGVIDHRPVSSSCLIVPIGMPPLEPTSVIAP